MDPQSFEHRRRASSWGSDDSHTNAAANHRPAGIEPALLVYHDSARSIVFRDHIRRAERHHQHLPQQSSEGDIANFQPRIKPLDRLELNASDTYKPLLDQDIETATLTSKEQQVINLMRTQHAAVKTIQNREWTHFLGRFKTPQKTHARYPDIHDDQPASDDCSWNSFVTSTSLLPPLGFKMRSYGSTKEYTTGCVFSMPANLTREQEDELQSETLTWSWPSGYAAKTEFNIDSSGKLINGRQEALVSFSKLRQQNITYTTETDYEIGGRMIRGGLNTVPYNEVYLRVGGSGDSLDRGVGLPCALFTRDASYGHLISMLRHKSHVVSVLGDTMKDLPLLYIEPSRGCRVLTEELQGDLWKIVAKRLNPFQNATLAHKTTISSSNQEHLDQKIQELLDLDTDAIKQTLTQEERARLAGGFGGTDDSVVNLLMEAMDDGASGKASPNHLQEVVNDGLAAAVQSADYNTARQLLILYTLVASHKDTNRAALTAKDSTSSSDSSDKVMFCDAVVPTNSEDTIERRSSIPPPPPPPPLDTDRLRSATNSDGLLAVLGAAQILKAMQDGGAQRRSLEAVEAISEWIDHGENSVAFRLASWREQREAQSDLKIAMQDSSSFMAFVSNKAISNRKKFCSQLKAAIDQTNFESVRFLQAIYEMVSKMHSPCLRLELLQYVLGLDNRYSVAHVARSVELATTCLSVSATSLSLASDSNKIGN